MVSDDDFDEHPSLPTSPTVLRREHTQLREMNKAASRETSHLEPCEGPGQDTSFSSVLDMERQFDLIASKVTETIQSITSIYNEIGYTSLEIAGKKSEIFEAMNSTIVCFKSNLERERNSISNECEWLRQQIRVILAMLNDHAGEKHLRLSSRGIVFDDELMYTEGCKEDVLQHMSKLNTKRTMGLLGSLFQFLDDGPGSPTSMLFSKHLGVVSSTDHSGIESRLSELGESHQVLLPALSPMNAGIALNTQRENLSTHTPRLSLLQYRSLLNLIFLEVLKAFVKVFKRFNELNRVFWENVETVTEDLDGYKCVGFSEFLPNKSDAESQAALVADFESTLEKLNMTSRNYNPHLRQGLSDSAPEDVAFIISSPRKRKQSVAIGEASTDPNASSDEGMNLLREINYKLVHTIRGLRVTKITNETIAQLAEEVENTEKAIEIRVARMRETIADCLHAIVTLSLTELDFIAIQRMQGHAEREKQVSNTGEGLFDVETLKFIQMNPREFGVMDHHLSFIAKLTRTLQKIKDSKQRKWEQYHQVCVSLWDKLGESRSYTEAFLAENTNLTDLALANFKMELKRLYTKRSEYVDSFIFEARKQVMELYSKLLYSDAQRQEFKYIHYDMNDATEDKEQILNELEAEIEKLKRDYANKEPVLSLYAQLHELLEDQKFLVESSKDSSRLLSKNSCKILLNEERLRKKINKNMPRVLAALKHEIISYNDKVLSEGLLPITAGNDDMFEKVLLIEADLSIHGGKSIRKAAAVPTSRNTSPKKSSVSPSRVQKPAAQWKSPPLAGSTFTRQAPQTRSLPPRSRLVSQKSGASPDRRSPKTEGRLVLETRRAPTNAVLMPLQTALVPHGPVNAGHSPAGRSDTSNSSSSSNNTLYSMCARVSPLRTASNANRSFSSNVSPLKMSSGGSVETEGKENSVLGYSAKPMEPIHSLLKGGRRPGEDPVASSGSLANSTILGDDYQTWRDERIQQINGDDLDLC